MGLNDDAMQVARTSPPASPPTRPLGGRERYEAEARRCAAAWLTTMGVAGRPEVVVDGFQSSPGPMVGRNGARSRSSVSVDVSWHLEGHEYLAYYRTSNGADDVSFIVTVEIAADPSGGNPKVRFDATTKERLGRALLEEQARLGRQGRGMAGAVNIPAVLRAGNGRHPAESG